MVKKIILLVVLALVLWAGIAYWPEKDVRTTPEAEFTWPDLYAGKVERIGLQADGRNFALAFSDGVWSVDLPEIETDPRAEDEKVAALIEFISMNKPKSRLGLIDGLEAYGLAEPRAVLDISGKLNLSIGSDSPDGDGVYALVQGEPDLLLLPLEYGARLTRKPEQYFDMRLFGLKAGEIKSVEIDSDAGESWKISLEDDKFTFKAPEDKIGDPVSPQEMDLYLHTVLSARAAALLFDAPAGPLEKLARLTLSAKGGSETMRLWVSGDSLVGRSDHQPLPFRLDHELRDKIVKSAFELTDRKVLKFDLGKIARFRISRENRELTAVRGESAWVPEDGGAENLLGIDMNLWRLTDLRYESEPAKERPGTAQQALTLTFWNKKDEPVAELEFFTDTQLPEGRIWITVSGDRVYYPVSAQIYKDLAGLLPPADNGDAGHGLRSAD